MKTENCSDNGQLSYYIKKNAQNYGENTICFFDKYKFPLLEKTTSANTKYQTYFLINKAKQMFLLSFSHKISRGFDL